MAITLADFDKIWASTSPLTPYSFSESNYKQGWNFIGNTPPARQMWDFLQKQNDEKMQYLLNNCIPLSNNAGCHNSVYRGKNLGTSVTAEQYAEVSVGTFRDMFVGDYWVINGVNYRIGGFNYWYNKGEPLCQTNHILIIPDTILTSAKMNETDTTVGAYIGSDYYTGNNGNTGKATAQTAINNAFGAAHILTHKEYLANAVTNGVTSAGAFYDSTIELMNEHMVYGGKFFEQAVSNGTSFPSVYSISTSQIPLFALAPQYIGNGSSWWLRDVVTDKVFASVSYAGIANSPVASRSYGIRPAFGIIA